MSIKGAEPDHRRITPHLMVKNTREAVDWYKKAMGAEVLYLAPLPNGEHSHAHLRIADTVVMLTQEHSDPKKQMEMTPGGLAAPQTLGGTTVIFELYLDDVDAAFERAVQEGGTPLQALSETFWGDRFGYIWALSMVKEELTREEVQRRMEEMFAKMQHGPCEL